jgi:hypothetical protein
MSEKEMVISDDLKLQIKKLEGYQVAAERHFPQAMRQATRLLSDEIRPNIPILSHRAYDFFGVHILGQGLELTGYVGWKGKPTAWWMNVVEYGARRHELTPKGTMRTRGGARAFRQREELGLTPKGQHVMVRGQWKTIGIHPGFGGRHILSDAYKQNEAAVESFFAQAADRVLEELTINAR